MRIDEEAKRKEARKREEEFEAERAAVRQQWEAHYRGIDQRRMARHDRESAAVEEVTKRNLENEEAEWRAAQRILARRVRRRSPD